MSTVRKLVGLVFVCLGAAALMTACPEPGEVTCTTDAECLASEVCVNEVCEATCEGDEECPDGDCVERPDGEGDEMICEDAGEGCNFDDDCLGDDICYDGDFCVKPCSDNDDCEFDEICDERDDSDSDDTNICFGPPHECTPETQGEDCPDGWICQADEEDETGDCIDPDDLDDYFTLQIVDETEDYGAHIDDDDVDDRCEDSTYGYQSAGAKIYDVILLDNGESSYGEYAYHEFGDHTEFDDVGIFDGEPKDFEATCPDSEELDYAEGHDNHPGSLDTNFRPDAVVALGCGGQLFLHFTDEDGDHIPLTEDHQIEILSYGETCGEEYETVHDGTHKPQSQTDPYSANLCTDFTESGSIDADTCDAPLGEGDILFGDQLLDVELPH